MFLTQLFKKKNELTKTHTFSRHPLQKPEAKKTDLYISRNISSEITCRLYNTINQNIDRDIRRFGKSVMNPSMLADLSRMNYFIDNKKYPFREMRFNLKLTFPLRSLNPKINGFRSISVRFLLSCIRAFFLIFLALCITGRPVMAVSWKSLWFLWTEIRPTPAFIFPAPV